MTTCICDSFPKYFHKVLNCILDAYLQIQVLYQRFLKCHVFYLYFTSLARQLRSWSGSKRMQLLGAMMCYIFHALIPGASYSLAMCCYAKLPSPWGLCLTMALLYCGFFYPMLRFHRIIHPAKWPSPSMLGAFIFGICITNVFYFIQVLPNIL